MGRHQKNGAPPIQSAPIQPPVGLEFAYVDECGDDGRGGSSTFTLGCVIVQSANWDESLGKLQDLRRELRDRHGLRMRDEVKASWIASTRQWAYDLGLGDGQLRNIYFEHMRLIREVAAGVFAVVIVKDKFYQRKDDVFETAWEYLLQRLRIRASITGVPIVLVHDAGWDKRTRTIYRRFRRHSFAPGGKPTAAPLLVEDPVPRDSAASYFIQLADLAAYAASRKIIPPKAGSKPDGKKVQLMWDELGDKRMSEVVRGGSDGIVVYPR